MRVVGEAEAKESEANRWNFWRRKLKKIIARVSSQASKSPLQHLSSAREHLISRDAALPGVLSSRQLKSEKVKREEVIEC